MRRFTGILTVVVALAGIFNSPAAAQTDRIEYRLRARDVETHLLDVAISLQVAGGVAVDFQMPAWSPGRYVIYDFSRNVQEVGAHDATGQPMPVTKIDKQTWRIVPTSGRVTFSYRVYANDLSGTFSQFDSRHANVNGPSVFMYVVGRKALPVRLTVEVPRGWGIYNAMSGSELQSTFDFPNYDMLLDTPTEAAPDFDIRTFEVSGVRYRLLIHQLGDDRSRTARFAADVERLVRAAADIVGPLDSDRYTFLVHFDPDSFPDGMEHLNSAQIVRGESLEDDQYEDLLTVTAHELFHAWNVKRLRPVELGPWDYTKENYSTSLWIAEGITSYYADVILLRCGILNRERFLNALERQISVLQSAPGRKLMSLEQSSFDSWLHIATRGRQRSNPDLPVNYYNKGHVVGALLDLEIRKRTHGTKSLDDVFRLMYKRFYLEGQLTNYYLKGRGFRGPDFLAAVNEVSSSDFSTFFSDYVTGVDELDYEATLAHVGLRLERRRANSFEIAVVERPTPEALSLRDAWLPTHEGRAPQQQKQDP